MQIETERGQTKSDHAGWAMTILEDAQLKCRASSYINTERNSLLN